MNTILEALRELRILNEDKGEEPYNIEELSEDIDEYSDDMLDNEGYIITDEYYSHSTSTPLALYNILNKIDKEGNQSEFNIAKGVNLTTSFSNQFLKERGKTDLLPAAIKRNPKKFIFGVTLDKKVIKDLEVEKYHDLRQHFDENDISRLLVKYIFKTKLGGYYLKIYFWPDIFKINKQIYDKIKHLMENQPKDSTLNNRIEYPKPGRNILGHTAKERGGKLEPSDISELISFKFAGPALTKNEMYKDFDKLSREEIEVELKERSSKRAKGKRGRPAGTAHIYLTDDEINLICNSFQGNEHEIRVTNSVRFELEDISAVWIPNYYIPKSKKGETEINWQSQLTKKGSIEIFNLMKYYSNNMNRSFLNDIKFKSSQAEKDYIQYLDGVDKLFQFLKSNNLPCKFYDYKTITIIN